MGLPAAIERHLERNLPADAPARRRVRLGQRGELQLSPGGRRLRFRAEQEWAVDRVEFSWRAEFRIARLVPLTVRDWYRDGSGGLEGRLFGRVPVLRAGGADVARGEAMRYLAELPWLPQALRANERLQWRELGERSAEVATLVGGVRAAVELHLDEAGDVVAAYAADRPRLVGKRAVPTPFRGVFGGYAELGGVRIPTTAEVAWLLPEGPFTYFRCELTGAAGS